MKKPQRPGPTSAVLSSVIGRARSTSIGLPARNQAAVLSEFVMGDSRGNLRKKT